MRFLTIHRPLVAAVAGISRTCLAGAAPPRATQWAQLANAMVLGQRHASVKAQGAYKKKSKRGIPKKLGAKRIGGT